MRDTRLKGAPDSDNLSGMARNVKSTGEIWNEIQFRRLSNGLVLVEAAIIGFVVGLYSQYKDLVTTPTAWGIGIAVFFAVVILFRIPIVGLVIALAISGFWGWIAWMFGLLGSTTLGVVVGLVVFVLSLFVHVEFNRRKERVVD